MICLDASVAIKLVLQEEGSDRTRALFRSTLQADQTIVAPALLYFEVTNIIRQRMRRLDKFSLADAHLTLADFLALPIEINSSAELHQEALRIAETYGLPAAYDAHYVALAQLLGCEIWTDDKRLLRQVQRDLQFVRWIGDYVVPG